ncbi:YqcC family protein [Piscirickettsia litoralis]|uniref:tRNA pseudouridine synthase C n=1 Tax=Piscirickettsia litoralis TaxID=1891921 RepID=A0ABX3A7S3_9GAMM|nr:YqcC family protein [Piscirickettsia litoralis]ODN42149.1 tRNA pseudouridine synthase C [Piscirickettsia litoralis]
MKQAAYVEIASLLLELEKALRAHSLWEEHAPAESALSSQEPFCVDTLAFSQWVQWIFLPRMKVIVETQGNLPLASNIMPMAEEGLKAQGVNGQEIIQLFKQFDDLVSQ